MKTNIYYRIIGFAKDFDSAKGFDSAMRYRLHGLSLLLWITDSDDSFDVHVNIV
jgi:hypothetical protein